MQDDAALRADEIAAGLPQVCFLDHGRYTFEPTRWDPGGSVVFAEQPPRLRRVGSQYAICLSLGRLVEEPDACPRRKTVIALRPSHHAVAEPFDGISLRQPVPTPSPGLCSLS